MTRLLLAPGFLLLAVACAPDPEPVEVIVVGEEVAAGDVEYLNSERDPEGDSINGEPAGSPVEALDDESTNDDDDGNDPIETADEDADPL